jgi:hypothetical protein
VHVNRSGGFEEKYFIERCGSNFNGLVPGQIDSRVRRKYFCLLIVVLILQGKAMERILQVGKIE